MASLIPSGNAAGTGSMTLSAPATNSNQIITLPDATGNIVVAGANSAIVSGTAQASTSGTTIPFTGLPSWVKRITVMLSGVSTNGTNFPQIQLGTGATPTWVTSGYASYCFNGTAVPTVATASTGFVTGSASATNALHGTFVLTLLGSDTWTCFGGCGQNSSNTSIVMGSVSLGATLTAVRVGSVNTVDTFDAGSINILYE